MANPTLQSLLRNPQTSLADKFDAIQKEMDALYTASAKVPTELMNKANRPLDLGWESMAFPSNMTAFSSPDAAAGDLAQVAGTYKELKSRMDALQKASNTLSSITVKAIKDVETSAMTVL